MVFVHQNRSCDFNIVNGYKLRDRKARPLDLLEKNVDAWIVEQKKK